MNKIITILFITSSPFYILAQNTTEYYKNGNIKFEQKVQNDSNIKYSYYENGKKQREAYFDIYGTWIGYKTWSEQGDIKASVDFIKERKEKGPTDLSFIKWNRPDSVLMYKVTDSLKMENSKLAKKGDTIIFHYICMDDQGYEYDNSISRNNPIIMIVDKTPFLKSFSDCLIKLNVGNKAYIRIPPMYGYGDKPAGNVPPKTTLVYYVEILAIK